MPHRKGPGPAGIYGQNDAGVSVTWWMNKLQSLK